MNYEQLREQFKHNITFYCYDHTLTPDRDEPSIITVNSMKWKYLNLRSS